MSFLLPMASQDFGAIRPFDARIELFDALDAYSSTEAREALGEAQQKLGQMLASGELRSYAKHAGRWHAISREAWSQQGLQGERSLITNTYCIYPANDDAREIEGCDWCIDSKGWQKAIASLLGLSLPQRGRPRGSGIKEDDRLTEMHRLVSEEEMSVNAAALAVVPNDSRRPESDNRRLRRKYELQFGQK